MSKKTFVLPVEADPCPELLVDEGPDGGGVGSWVPAQKYTLLAKMLGGTRYARKAHPRRIFIDPFCGPGRVRVRSESFTRDGGAVVAWRHSQQFGCGFTKVLVGDLDGNRAGACEKRLLALGAPVQAFTGPAVETIKKMVATVPKDSGTLTLAYIDPYNLKFLSFEIMKALAALDRVDLLVHFSTMDLTRNVDLELDRDRARFDPTAPGWREQAGARSKGNLSSGFFDYWHGLVSALGFKASEQQPLVTNDQNRGIYRLVFFSRHPLANKVWGDVAKGPNRELPF